MLLRSRPRRCDPQCAIGHLSQPLKSGLREGEVDSMAAGGGGTRAHVAWVVESCLPVECVLYMTCDAALPLDI